MALASAQLGLPQPKSGGQGVTRVPTRNHRPEFLDREMSARKDSVGKPKNLYHFLVVAKDAGKMASRPMEQYQSARASHNRTSEVVEPLGLTSSSSPEDNFYCETASQRDQSWLISFAPAHLPSETKSLAPWSPERGAAPARILAGKLLVGQGNPVGPPPKQVQIFSSRAGRCAGRGG